jgi:mRNA interferase MazF
LTARGYVPQAGDIVWLNFSPRAGHEQGGHRPAIVLSHSAYNRSAGLMICCPVSTRIKAYPFEVALGGTAASVALADHACSVDWRARGAVFKARTEATALAEIRAKRGALIL